MKKPRNASTHAAQSRYIRSDIPLSAEEVCDMARIRQQVCASMPSGPRVCVLCGGHNPGLVGAGIVDGIAIGYALCQACFTPAYVERITAKVRGDLFLRRRN